MPVIRDWFKNMVRDPINAGDKNLRRLTNIPSCPNDDFMRRDLGILVTHCDLVTPYVGRDPVNIGSGNGFLQLAPSHHYTNQCWLH